MSLAVTSVLLAAIPSPDRGVWFLGPVPIRAYALCIIAGIIIAVLWGERRFVARGGEEGVVTDVAVYAVPFGLVGGRLYHVATDWPKYFGPGADPIDALKIWQGGLGIWGAVALGAVGAWIGCRRRGVPLPFFADAVAPGIVVAQAVGRLGNWFNQELYGRPTDLPWALEIYRRVDPVTGAPDPLTGVALDVTPIATVHPTFLYELLWNLGVAALVVGADRRFRLGHGRAFALYVAGYTAGRFWIEQMRDDEATRVFGDIRINVVVSVVVFVAAVLYLLLVRKPREELAFATVGGGDADADADGAAPDRSAGTGTGTGTGQDAGTAIDRGPAPVRRVDSAAAPDRTAGPDGEGAPDRGAGPDKDPDGEKGASLDKDAGQADATGPDKTTEPGNTTGPDGTTDPDETADPSTAAAPDETADPDETAGPDETADPDETAGPDETADPDKGAGPDRTADPNENDNENGDENAAADRNRVVAEPGERRP